MQLKVIYKDSDVLVINKPAGITVFPENEIREKTLIDYLLKRFPNLKNVGNKPRYGIIHRLDKDTSGILLIAKNKKALEFFQEQFKKRKVLKRYLALVVGNIKENQGKIETLIGRSLKNRKKQRVYLPFEPLAKGRKLRKAITEYRVLQRFKNFTLIEAIPKTGRKHQIRVHFSHLGHPIAGDRIYGFKNQPRPKNSNRLFLHSYYLKMRLPNGKEKEFQSPLPKDLKEVLENLDIIRI